MLLFVCFCKKCYIRTFLPNLSSPQPFGNYTNCVSVFTVGIQGTFIHLINSYWVSTECRHLRDWGVENSEPSWSWHSRGREKQSESKCMCNIKSGNNQSWKEELGHREWCGPGRCYVSSCIQGRPLWCWNKEREEGRNVLLRSGECIFLRRLASCGFSKKIVTEPYLCCPVRPSQESVLCFR